MNVLLVKTSSLGDVIHNLPVASDLRARFPDVRIDWVVEEGFTDIPHLHPGVRRVIPVALRRWRRTLLNPATWREMLAFDDTLHAEMYDLVIDTQGLLKSALIARRANGRRCGYAASSAREPLAARFYDATFNVANTLHAVHRNRQLVAQATGYRLADALDYGISKDSNAAYTSAQAILLTATSRDDKLWPEERWIELGRVLATRGIACRLPAGSSNERDRAERIARAIPDAETLPAMSLRELAGQLAKARLVVGVDTGLVHLAAALNRPTLALFCASDPALTGVLAGADAINLGDRNRPPSVFDVLNVAERWL
jgi:heptosyltransferase-1